MNDVGSHILPTSNRAGLRKVGLKEAGWQEDGMEGSTPSRRGNDTYHFVLFAQAKSRRINKCR